MAPRTKTEVRDEVAEATAALADAEAVLADVELRILDPDAAASTAELLAAEAGADAARALLGRATSIEAARIRRAVEAARLQRISDLDALISTRFGDHEAGLIAAFDAAVAALVPLVEAVADHNEALSEIRAELLASAPLPARLAPSATSNVIHLPADDVFVTPLDPRQLLVEALWRASTAAGDRATAGSFVSEAGVGVDRASAVRFGLAQNPDGTAPASGVSDELRRTARIVTARKDA